MRFWIGVTAILSVPTAALACSCLATDDPEQLRSFAADAAKDAVALVEVETLVSYQESNGAGDRMRVVHTLAGSAQPEFKVQRGEFPSGASCDLLFDRGQRAVVILYPAATPSDSEPIYRISGLCTGVLMDEPIFRDAVSRGIGRSRLGERG